MQCGAISNKTPWTTLGDNCYHISNLAMSWDEAQRYCWGVGGHLAEIMSREEEELLDTFLVGGIKSKEFQNYRSEDDQPAN